MGLFDFAKDLGKKLFGSGDDPAQKIEESIAAANPGVDDLGVTFEDGVVHLSGNAASAEAMEKAVLMAGNVKGVTEVSALWQCHGLPEDLRGQQRGDQGPRPDLSRPEDPYPAEDLVRTS